MKRLLLIFVVYILQASPLDTEKEIYRILLHSIFPYKKSITIWIDNRKEFEALTYIKELNITKKPYNADILFISDESSLEKIDPKKIIFVNSYSLLKKYQKSVIGGFFWQKGRPNILFLRKSLQRYHINLPLPLYHYIEDEL